MKTLEIRRHAYTKKGNERGKGSHLSAEGVKLARAIGETIGACDLVLTSHIPRTLETALAMGYAVHDQLAILGDIPDEMFQEVGHHNRWLWHEPFTMFAQLLSAGGATAQVGQQLRETFKNVAEAIPNDGKALIITHGRLLEVGAVASFPDGDFAQWGKPFAHGEGIQLFYDEGSVCAIRFLRPYE
jgi:broad specificity phosphatase PhoE